MSSSILSHVWGIVGYDYLRTEYIGGKIIFHIDHKSSKLRCPICRSQNIILRGTKPRYIRGIPVGHKEVWFALDVQRIECQDCQHLGQVRLGFADPQVSYSRGFERYALELLQMTTITDVAHHLKSETSKSASGKSISRMFAGWPLMKLLSKRGIAT